MLPEETHLMLGISELKSTFCVNCSVIGVIVKTTTTKRKQGNIDRAYFESGTIE